MKNSKTETPSNPAAEDTPFNFSKYNKLHWMLGGEEYALKMAKEYFVKDLKRAQDAEKEHCKRNKVEAMMTGSIFNQICDLIDQCDTFFEVEATARYVFDDNLIPQIDQVKARAVDLKKIMPIFDTLHKKRNPRRSY